MALRHNAFETWQSACNAADATQAADGTGAAGTVGHSLHATGTARLPGVNVLHLDPYRLPEGKVASLIDLAPAFERHVCLVEWPERLGLELPEAWRLDLRHQDEGRLAQLTRPRNAST